MSASNREFISKFRSLHLGAVAVAVGYLAFLCFGDPIRHGLPVGTVWEVVIYTIHIGGSVYALGLIVTVIGAVLKWAFSLFGVDPNEYFTTSGPD